MMAVWAEDEDILCVHPTGGRLTGHDQVRESWAKMFAAGPRARLQVTQQVAISRHDARGAQRVRELLARRRGAGRRAAAADRRHQRVPAHTRGLAHDRAPRLARAAQTEPAPAARDAPPKLLH
jgi:hypothetical protein